MIKLEAKNFQPIFKISSSILNNKSLICNAVEPTFTGLLLPSLLVTYGPPLIANSVYKRFDLTAESLIIFGIGFLLSLLFHNCSWIMFILKEVPHVSKFFNLVDLKNSKENTFYLLAWCITADLCRYCIKKLVKQEKLQMEMKFLINIVSLYSGIFLMRKYNLNDYYVVVVANLVPLLTASIFSLLKIQTVDECAEKKKVKSSPKKRKTKKTQ